MKGRERSWRDTREGRVLIVLALSSWPEQETSYFTRARSSGLEGSELELESVCKVSGIKWRLRF